MKLLNPGLVGSFPMLAGDAKCSLKPEEEGTLAISRLGPGKPQAVVLVCYSNGRQLEFDLGISASNCEDKVTLRVHDVIFVREDGVASIRGQVLVPGELS